MCSIETHDTLCRDLAHQAGIIVISIGYRLAPEHKFPAGLEDCYAALQWIAKNVENLKVNPARLAIGGEYAYTVSILEFVSSTHQPLGWTHKRYGRTMLYLIRRGLSMMCSESAGSCISMLDCIHTACNGKCNSLGVMIAQVTQLEAISHLQR